MKSDLFKDAIVSLEHSIGSEALNFDTSRESYELLANLSEDELKGREEELAELCNRNPKLAAREYCNTENAFWKLQEAYIELHLKYSRLSMLYEILEEYTEDSLSRIKDLEHLLEEEDIPICV